MLNHIFSQKKVYYLMNKDNVLKHKINNPNIVLTQEKIRVKKILKLIKQLVS